MTRGHAGALGALLLTLGGCSEPPPQRPAPVPAVTPDSRGLDLAKPAVGDGGAVAKESAYFTDLATMTASAPLVIRGWVARIAVGEPEFDPGDPSGRPVLTARVVTLEVLDVLRSEGAAPRRCACTRAISGRTARASRSVG